MVSFHHYSPFSKGNLYQRNRPNGKFSVQPAKKNCIGNYNFMLKFSGNNCSKQQNKEYEL